MRATATRRYTYDDLRETPDDGLRYEIIDGELIVSAAPTRWHQEIQQLLNRWFDRASGYGQLGKLFSAPVDIKFATDNVVEPDLLFIRRSRLGIYRHEGFMEAPPDIVVEIVSPSSRDRDLDEKLALYAAQGVPEYWVADYVGPTLRLFVLSEGTYQEIAPTGGRLRSLVLPDLVIVFADLFDDLQDLIS